MTIYYIDPSAGTDGSGTEGSPFNNWTSVTWAAGNSYLQKRGTTWTGQVSIQASGTAGNRVVMGAYGTGARPVIDSNNAQSISINIGTDYTDITVESFEVKGATLRGITNYTTDGVADVPTRIEVLDCHVHDMAVQVSGIVSGIQLWGSDNRVEGCRVHDIPADGIWMKGPRPIVRRCSVYRCGLDGLDSGDSLQFTDDSRDMIVEWNFLDHSANPNKGCFGYGGPVGSGGRVNNNWMRRPSTGLGATAHIIYNEGAGIRFYENILDGGVYGINCTLTAENCIIERNLVINATTALIAMSGPGGIVRDNRAVGTGLYGILVDQESTTNVFITRNIVSGVTRGIARPAGTSTESYNLVFGTTVPFCLKNGTAIDAGTGSTTTTPSPVVPLWTSGDWAKTAGILGTKTLPPVYARENRSGDVIGRVQVSPSVVYSVLHDPSAIFTVDAATGEISHDATPTAGPHAVTIKAQRPTDSAVKTWTIA